MRTHRLTWPELMLIAGTRAMLGGGVGLLLAPRLRRTTRRTLGYSLLSVGLLSTLPLLARVRRSGRPATAGPRSYVPTEPVLGL